MEAKCSNRTIKGKDCVELQASRTYARTVNVEPSNQKRSLFLLPYLTKMNATAITIQMQCQL